VAIAEQKDIPIQIHTIGNVEAYSTVSVKARVEGELLRVYFKEGQEVKKGDLLFLIDSRPFKASLKQFEANLARDTAQMKKAEADVLRYNALLKSGVVSKQEYDQYHTNLKPSGRRLRPMRPLW
jgi:Multidrug resistance efflux pump